jgi:predicted metal-binding membrane protein
MSENVAGTVIARSPPGPIVLWGAVGVAWCAALVAEVAGSAALVHHHAIFEGSHSPLGAVVAVGAFLVAWQVMVVAMMLPSSVTMMHVFAARARSGTRPRESVLAFVGGYLLVWGIFGAAALIGDGLVHQTVDGFPWLAARPWLVAGAVIALAGAFQFSALRAQCQRVCRHPIGFLAQRYQPGVDGAFALGREHARFCVGCCWALMLVMFAAGMANLVWMAALGAVMVYEKVGRHGEALAPVVGVVLIVWAMIVVAHPIWLPVAFSGGAS